MPVDIKGLCRNYLIVKAHSFLSCLGGWSQTIPQMKKPDVAVLGWRSYTWSAVGRPVGRTAKFFKTKLLMVEKLTLHSLATALVDILSVSMPIAHSLKTSVALCCDKTTHFRVAFYCPQHKVDLCNDDAV